jgi:hypothetical protein
VLPQDVTMYIEVNDMVIPNTQYTVNAKKNTLTFDDVDNELYDVKIAYGNYNALTLMSALNTCLAAYSEDTPANTMTTTYNSINNKYRFVSSSYSAANGTYEIEPFCFNYDGTSTLLPLIGFDSSASYVSYNGSGVGTCYLDSEQNIDLSGNNSIYITTNLNTENAAWVYTNADSNGRASNVLAKVQFDSNSGGINFSTSSKSFKSKITDKYINSITFRLYDEDFVAYVPDIDWSITLDLTFYEAVDGAGNTAVNMMDQHRSKAPLL